MWNKGEMIGRVSSVLIFNTGFALIFCLLRVYSIVLKKFSKKKKEERGREVQKLFGQLSRFFVTRVLKLKWKEDADWSKLGSSGRGVILLMNHSSLFDVVAVASVLPLNLSKRLRFVVSNGVLRIPLIGQSIQEMNAIFVPFRVHEDSGAGINHDGSFKLAPGGKTQVKKAILDHCSQHENIALMCPEGKIGKQGGTKVLPFRRGAFELALNSDLEIYAIVLAGVASVWAPRAPCGGLTSPSGLKAALVPIAPEGARHLVSTSSEFFISPKERTSSDSPTGGQEYASVTSSSSTESDEPIYPFKDGPLLDKDNNLASLLANYARNTVQSALDDLNNPAK